MLVCFLTIVSVLQIRTNRPNRELTNDTVQLNLINQTDLLHQFIFRMERGLQAVNHNISRLQDARAGLQADAKDKACSSYTPGVPEPCICEASRHRSCEGVFWTLSCYPAGQLLLHLVMCVGGSHPDRPECPCCRLCYSCSLGKRNSYEPRSSPEAPTHVGTSHKCRDISCNWLGE